MRNRLHPDPARRAFAARDGNNPPAAPLPHQIPAKFPSATLSFEPNLGQTGPAVQFLPRGPGFSLFLGSGMSLLAANPQPKAAGLALKAVW